MTVKRKIIEIDEDLCDGCGQCAIACAEGAIVIVDDKAKVVSDNLCDGLGACIGECPQGALKIIEREADEFDEAAVEEHLAGLEEEVKEEGGLPCGCPSTQVQSFYKSEPAKEAVKTEADKPSQSYLSSWPIQIKLIPPAAPFLKEADLLILADCVPAAYASVHEEFIRGRIVMMGCPKLDNAQEYMEKFAQIFTTQNIKSIIIMMMEVPCCAGMGAIIKRAMSIAGKNIPLSEVIIGIRGEKKN